ncbi:MAG TPA: hypothetical protein VJT31_22425 [Rugosimonospora sp.]|nr:hypothetical protein [Rugosimonospora sp.]
MSDRITAEYVHRCHADERLRSVVHDAAYPPLFFASCGKRLLGRPFFIEEAQIRGIADDLVTLFDILVSLPGRLFDGDLDRYCAALGIEPRRAALLRRFGGGRPTLYGRADLYHDGTSFKLLEFNVGSELGGADRAEISRAVLDVPAFREFADEHHLGYVHTGRQVAKLLRETAAPYTASDRPVVALLEADGGLGPYLHLVHSFQEMMRGLDIDLVIGEVGQVAVKDGYLHLDGQRIDVVLRYFSADQLVEDPRGEQLAEAVFRAHEDGKVGLLTTMESGLYANKGTLALLSDQQFRAAFSPAEAALIDRVLPWTRSLVAGPAQVGTDTVDLIEYCRDNREQLILKPRGDFGGAGIVVGWEQSDRDWRQSLVDCSGDRYVVQQRVEPRREPVVDPDTGTVEEWLATWDAFLTPDGYAGSHIRALPAGGGAIIGMGASASARTSGVFYYPST